MCRSFSLTRPLVCACAGITHFPRRPWLCRNDTALQRNFLVQNAPSLAAEVVLRIPVKEMLYTLPTEEGMVGHRLQNVPHWYGLGSSLRQGKADTRSLSALTQLVSLHQWRLSAITTYVRGIEPSEDAGELS